MIVLQENTHAARYKGKVWRREKECPQCGTRVVLDRDDVQHQFFHDSPNYFWACPSCRTPNRLFFWPWELWPWQRWVKVYASRYHHHG